MLNTDRGTCGLSLSFFMGVGIYKIWLKLCKENISVEDTQYQNIKGSHPLKKLNFVREMKNHKRGEV